MQKILVKVFSPISEYLLCITNYMGTYVEWFHLPFVVADCFYVLSPQVMRFNLYAYAHNQQRIHFYAPILCTTEKT